MSEAKPKIFIIGASGFLGYHLALALQKKFLISGAYFSNPVFIPNAQLFPISVQNMDILESIIRIQEPNIIINAMGITDRELCKEQPKITESFNVMLPVSWAVLAAKTKAKYIHLSCAEIYDGSKGQYDETDSGYALQHEFGRQKFASETYIRAQTLESTILRLGKVVGLGNPYRKSYFDTLRGKILAKQPYLSSKGKTYSYLSTDAFSEAVEQILTNPIPVKHRTFNLGGVNLKEEEFVRTYISLLGLDEKLLKFPSDDHEKRDLSLNSKSFQENYPQWKIETKSKVFERILLQTRPALSLKRWQKTLQTL